MKVITIVGARPQFIKSALVSKALREADHCEYLVHTGQHYDYEMSQIFFEELEIPRPDINLGVGSGEQGQQTGEMLIGLERVVQTQEPDWVLVYGDTNSTLAGALAAAKLQIPLAHVEAGLRSFNRKMPEEINRIVTDHLASLWLCPSQVAADNLSVEGIKQNVHVIGDVMYEVLLLAAEKARQHSEILKRLELTDNGYLLATVHRAENTDDPERLGCILTAFARIEEPIVFPVHPRTRRAISLFGFSLSSNIIDIEPVGYLDMIRLEQGARIILTDSGGIQKESYWLHVPCLTLRNETEWIETVQAGWNHLVGTDVERITQYVQSTPPCGDHKSLYAKNAVARSCVGLLSDLDQ